MLRQYVPIINEIRNGLMKKFGWSQREVEEAFDFYFSRAIHAEVRGILRGICRDPKDDMILECAVLGKADFIVSGDKDLLTIGSFQGIQILSPRDFLKLHETSNAGS